VDFRPRGSSADPYPDPALCPGTPVASPGPSPEPQPGQPTRAPPSQPILESVEGQATQVVSHGWHHHNRLRVASAPSLSGLNAHAGWSQNRHAGPAAGASTHPTALAVAACIPSNLGVLTGSPACAAGAWPG
jgi:hypothetical protein